MLKSTLFLILFLRLFFIPLTCAYGQTQNQDLIDACRVGDLEKVKQILPHIQDINARDLGGRTALRQPIIKLLLEKGANVNSRDNYGHTPLMLAASHSNLY